MPEQDFSSRPNFSLARVLLFTDLLLVGRANKEKLKILWQAPLVMRVLIETVPLVFTLQYQDSVMIRVLVTGQVEIAYFGGSEFWVLAVFSVEEAPH